MDKGKEKPFRKRKPIQYYETRKKRTLTQLVNQDKRTNMTQISLQKLHSMLNKSLLSPKGKLAILKSGAKVYTRSLYSNTGLHFNLSIFKDLPMTFLKYRHLIPIVNVQSWKSENTRYRVTKTDHSKIIFELFALLLELTPILILKNIKTTQLSLSGNHFLPI